jgi:hypothetical protein
MVPVQATTAVVIRVHSALSPKIAFKEHIVLVQERSGAERYVDSPKVRRMYWMAAQSQGVSYLYPISPSLLNE